MTNYISTGLVHVAGYANKLRRTAFAVLNEAIKAGNLSPDKLVYRIARINEQLFKILVEELGLSKTDVVRVRLPYRLAGDGDIEFILEDAVIEVYTRDDELSARATALLAGERAEYEVVRLGVNVLGNELYELRKDGKRVAVVTAMRIGDKVVIEGISIEPPRRLKAIYDAASFPRILGAAARTLIEAGEEIPAEDAERLAIVIASSAKK